MMHGETFFTFGGADPIEFDADSFAGENLNNPEPDLVSMAAAHEQGTDFQDFDRDLALKQMVETGENTLVPDESVLVFLGPDPSFTPTTSVSKERDVQCMSMADAASSGADKKRERQSPVKRPFERMVDRMLAGEES